MLLTKVVRMRAVYFAILTLPMAMSPVAVALIWKMLLQPNLGIVNTTLASFGISAVDWLNNPDLALSTLVFVEIWQRTSFVVLLLSAGLASLPRDPYKLGMMAPVRSPSSGTSPRCCARSRRCHVIQLINEFRTKSGLCHDQGRAGHLDDFCPSSPERAFQGLAINESNAAAFMLLLVVLAITVVFFWILERGRRTG